MKYVRVWYDHRTDVIRWLESEGYSSPEDYTFATINGVSFMWFDESAVLLATKFQFPDRIEVLNPIQEFKLQTFLKHFGDDLRTD